MSWSYTVHQINRSLEQIALWYQDFLHRSEAAFRALHDRITYLEQQQQSSQGPSDEQVEQVLRKILADRFSDGATQPTLKPNEGKDGQHFVKPPDSASVPRPPAIDPAALQVDPTAVPSKVYGQTFQMLEKELHRFPQTEVSKSALKATTVKNEGTANCPAPPPDHGRPW
ncbi:hypothetical protein BU23DRAFT_461758 [Bimuria novae-zelandiae CBS 107.79]|uniref:Uncharacterized protein n=1 Tax=Bimuria novae-zelandiae CBS 107.79 TaxID=1447943 RepID=A0A6A5VM09_9PLEO|nr:hypothetical protein BU23DRAFT_461758 [Bimuria novae-zelandiae CBS 107.79]